MVFVCVKWLKYNIFNETIRVYTKRDLFSFFILTKIFCHPKPYIEKWMYNNDCSWHSGTFSRQHEIWEICQVVQCPQQLSYINFKTTQCNVVLFTLQRSEQITITLSWKFLFWQQWRRKQSFPSVKLEKSSLQIFSN